MAQEPGDRQKDVIPGILHNKVRSTPYAAAYVSLYFARSEVNLSVDAISGAAGGVVDPLTSLGPFCVLCLLQGHELQPEANENEPRSTVRQYSRRVKPHFKLSCLHTALEAIEAPGGKQGWVSGCTLYLAELHSPIGKSDPVPRRRISDANLGSGCRIQHSVTTASPFSQPIITF